MLFKGQLLNQEVCVARADPEIYKIWGESEVFDAWIMLRNAEALARRRFFGRNSASKKLASDF
jgi:hypothetical protein